jgi:hypothetical protein
LTSSVKFMYSGSQRVRVIGLSLHENSFQGLLAQSR